MYFVHFGQGLTLRNNLEKAVSTTLKEVDRMRFEDDQLEPFKAEVNRLVAACNAAHPRCKPVQVSCYDTSFDEDDVCISFGGQIASLRLFYSDKTFQAI